LVLVGIPGRLAKADRAANRKSRSLLVIAVVLTKGGQPRPISGSDSLAAPLLGRRRRPATGQTIAIAGRQRSEAPRTQAHRSQLFWPNGDGRTLDEGLELRKIVGSQFAREVWAASLHVRPAEHELIEIGDRRRRQQPSLATLPPQSTPGTPWQNTQLLT